MCWHHLCADLCMYACRNNNYVLCCVWSANEAAATAFDFNLYVPRVVCGANRARTTRLDECMHNTHLVRERMSIAQINGNKSDASFARTNTQTCKNHAHAQISILAHFGIVEPVFCV